MREVKIMEIQINHTVFLKVRLKRYNLFPGEGIGYPFQYSWASLVAQMVRNPPVMLKTWVRYLGWEDPLEEGMAIPMD